MKTQTLSKQSFLSMWLIFFTVLMLATQAASVLKPSLDDQTGTKQAAIALK